MSKVELVKGAINALANDPTLIMSGAQSEKVVELATVVLESASKDLLAFSSFSKDLVDHLTAATTVSSNSSLSLIITKRYKEQMWTKFHRIRVTVLPKMWASFFEQLSLSNKCSESGPLLALKEELCLANI